MPTVVPGAVAWFEIGTTDADATEAFYSELFGWRFDLDTGSDPDAPAHGQIVGPTASTPGEPAPVGAIDVMPDGETGASAIGIFTDDVAAKVSQLEGLGAIVVDAPEPTADAGVAARVRDPLGNLLTLFSGDHHAVPGAAAGPGGVARFEIGSTDLRTTRRFYEQAFGWGFEALGDGSYHDIFCPDAREVSGGLWDQAGHGNDYATFSVLTDALTPTARQARHLGARQMAPATMNAEGVVSARLLDPVGALFGLVVIPNESSPRSLPHGG
jgi:hypothetical protein